ncbi:MAG: Chorismate binding-like protein [Pseudonocardiales bacterium]|nr:Chorismate binding-like protein [Pseudonocardiales bacterium]
MDKTLGVVGLTGVSIRALPAGPTPLHLVGSLPLDAVLLAGEWAGGGALIGIDPIMVIDDAIDPFAVFAGELSLPRLTAPAGTVGGGWFGWLAFDAGSPVRSARLPASYLAFYPNVLRYEASTGRWFDEALVGVVSPVELETRRRTLSALLSAGHRTATKTDPLGPFLALTGRSAYEAAVRACIAHIAAGDIYQANICLALEAVVAGDPLDAATGLAERLLEQLTPPFGAYLPTAQGAVISASPELFLRRTGRQVLSSPIKGTRPRPSDPLMADLEANRLQASAKDRAENVMIVDMVRNDLARVAETGSVRVSDLLRLEAHPGVWHLVSDVVATLRPDADDADLLRATFPPGSIVGTPKVRARQVIAELEPEPRGVYTGAIGYRSPVSGMELSVAIRTLEVAGKTARLGVGAGITAGSIPIEEWWECFDKAKPIARAIGSVVSLDGAERPAID